MKTLLCVLAVWVAGMAWADVPTSAPAGDASVQRMIRAMQTQIAELKDENQKLRVELAKTKDELAKAKPPGAAQVAKNAQITVGMTRAEAVAVCKKRNWVWEVTAEADDAVRGKARHTETWQFGGRQAMNEGSPLTVYFVDDSIVRVER